MTVPASWFTGARLERLAHVLVAYPRLKPSTDEQARDRILWRSFGGPISEIGQLVEVLLLLQLIEGPKGLRLTRTGYATASAARRGDRRPFARLLVQSGLFHDQVRRLVEFATLQPDGSLSWPRRKARAVAPQLVGLLRWWPGVTVEIEIRIPASVASEFSAIWASAPPPMPPAWADEKTAVGYRAEMFTVQRERERAANIAAIHWVSRETDVLGWDVEDWSVAPKRVIEVKGSRSASVTFVVTTNEWDRAAELGPRYEIQYWGSINLTRDPQEEFVLLQNLGYPIVIADLRAAVQAGLWLAEPHQYRVSRAGEVEDGSVVDLGNPDGTVAGL